MVISGNCSSQKKGLRLEVSESKVLEALASEHFEVLVQNTRQSLESQSGRMEQKTPRTAQAPEQISS